MRIDGRFDPKAWTQPRAEDVVISTNFEEHRPELEIKFTVSDGNDASTAFAHELETSYAYTHASRTAASVSTVLEKTPEL